MYGWIPVIPFGWQSYVKANPNKIWIKDYGQESMSLS